MAKYLMVYLGGDHPKTPEAGQAHFAKYMEWIKGLGEAAISPMNPIKDNQIVNADGSVESGSAMAMSGYTIVEAESMDAVLEMAKSCPFLEINGRLEVSEMVEMS